MTLYFDTRVQNSDIQSITSIVTWHQNLPFLAVASYSQEKGGYVTIYDDQGEPLPDVESPGNALAHVTAVAWHPQRRRFVAGWENGELRMWSGDIGLNEFNIIMTPHREPISILKWSQYGNRLVSTDNAGSIVGWKIDSRGQLLMMFHHELQDTFSHITFKINPPKPSYDNSGAIIPGDNRSNLFTSWRPRTAAPPAATSQRDNHAFYISTLQGMVYFVDLEGQCLDVLDTSGAPIYYMLHHQTRDALVVMTAGLNIGYFQANPENGKLVEITKVKLSGKGDLFRSSPGLCWVSINTLAILTGELAIRCWDLHTGDTYVLSPPDSDMDNAATPQEICTSLSYCKSNDTLAAGTNLGTIYLWKRKPNSEPEERSWPTYPESCTVNSTVKEIIWGAVYLRNPLLAVNCITNVFILHQQALCAAYNDGVSACQFSPTQVHIEFENLVCTLKTDLQIQIITVNKDHIVISSGRIVAVYKLINDKGLSTTVVTSFNCDTEKLLIYESKIIILTPSAIQLRSLEGGIIQTLPTLSEEGEPIAMDLTGHYLTVASLNGILKVWDLSKREAKLYVKPISACDIIEDFAEIIEAKCNSDCTFISITVAMANLMPSSILYVWDIENDRMNEFDFDENFKSDDDDNGLGSKCRGRIITAHCWDNDDPRLLICRAQKLDDRLPKDEEDALENV